MAGVARPVRMPRSSCLRYSRAFSMCSSVSRRMVSGSMGVAPYREAADCNGKGPRGAFGARNSRSAIAEVVEVFLVETEVMAEFVQERGADFLVDLLVGVLGLPSAGQGNDAAAEEVDDCRGIGVLDGAL